MQVEQWDIDRLRPYPTNPRKIPDSAIVKVAQSITEFGWQQPIVVDSDGVVVVGHTRLLAAKRLNLPTVPVHIAASLSPKQVKAYRLIDNRSNQEATWEFETLGGELKDLRLSDFNLALTGFSDMELGPLLGAQWTPETPTGDLGDFQKANTGDDRLVRLTEEQAEVINEACNAVRDTLEDDDLSTAECLVHICSMVGS